MPAVKSLHQQSAGNTKPRLHHGPFLPAVSVFVQAMGSALAVPLVPRPASGPHLPTGAGARSWTDWSVCSGSWPMGIFLTWWPTLTMPAARSPARSSTGPPPGSCLRCTAYRAAPKGAPSPPWPPPALWPQDAAPGLAGTAALRGRPVRLWRTGLRLRSARSTCSGAPSASSCRLVFISSSSSQLIPPVHRYHAGPRVDYSPVSVAL